MIRGEIGRCFSESFDSILVTHHVDFKRKIYHCHKLEVERIMLQHVNISEKCGEGYERKLNLQIAKGKEVHGGVQLTDGGKLYFRQDGGKHEWSDFGQNPETRDKLTEKLTEKIMEVKIGTEMNHTSINESLEFRLDERLN